MRSDFIRMCAACSGRENVRTGCAVIWLKRLQSTTLQTAIWPDSTQDLRKRRDAKLCI